MSIPKAEPTSEEIQPRDSSGGMDSRDRHKGRLNKHNPDEIYRVLNKMDRYEESSDESRCDKEIARIRSCRECVFNVLCRLERIKERNLVSKKQQ